MRYSREHKAQNHEKILSTAARCFRERGGDSSGIGTVMKKVGLKKGGFYRHFKSKDDLFVAAVARALDETGSGMVEVAKSAPEGQALRAIIERYLSAGHANSPGTGCVRAALGPELARKPVAVRRRIEALLEDYRERLLPFMPGQTREEKQVKIRLLFPSMAGVLMMARVSSDPQRREQILMEARNFSSSASLKSNFCVPKSTAVLCHTTQQIQAEPRGEPDEISWSSPQKPERAVRVDWQPIRRTPAGFKRAIL